MADSYIGSLTHRRSHTQSAAQSHSVAHSLTQSPSLTILHSHNLSHSCCVISLTILHSHNLSHSCCVISLTIAPSPPVAHSDSPSLTVSYIGSPTYRQSRTVPPSLTQCHPVLQSCTPTIYHTLAALTVSQLHHLPPWPTVIHRLSQCHNLSH